MSSGYTHCPDCGDVTVSSDTNKPELCWGCEELDNASLAEYEPDPEYWAANDDEWWPDASSAVLPWYEREPAPGATYPPMGANQG